MDIVVQCVSVLSVMDKQSSLVYSFSHYTFVVIIEIVAAAVTMVVM